ncbi:hypothetical protein ACIPSE_09110 [Streptomyces sp. NPDC090106]|uniref:hypothetical protein n=1 Tax=Streptomyces sp. NPDC090106 TaxID=3365946 RepID=UPI003805454F
MRPHTGLFRTPTARWAVAVACTAVLLAGCSSDRPAHAEEWQQDYCARLGDWQRAEHAGTTGETDDELAESLGRSAVRAARRLDRAGLELGGTRILDDTVDAVRGATDAEGRAVSYCDSAGFETLVR